MASNGQEMTGDVHIDDEVVAMMIKSATTADKGRSGKSHSILYLAQLRVIMALNELIYSMLLFIYAIYRFDD